MIVSNITSKNHLALMKELAKKSDTILLVSPFLSPDLNRLLKELLSPELKKVILVTTLKKEVQDTVLKSASLDSFVDRLKNAKVNWTININNKLHGKVYLFRKKERNIGCIVSSANFTENGMIKNNEWGILLQDPKEMEAIRTEIDTTIERRDITEKFLIDLREEATKHRRVATESDEKQKRSDKSVTDVFKKSFGNAFDCTVSYFIKPMGSTDGQVWEGDFSTDRNLYFSRRRPRAVRAGDILICYAVGPAQMLSIFRATSEPKNTGLSTDRWPWYVSGECLTSEYGKTWTKKGMGLTALVREYLSSNPQGIITFVGGKNLRALNRGSDKIKIAPEFARFVIQKMIGTQ